MIQDLFKTNIVEVVDSEVDPESQAGKLVLRVLEEKAWVRMMQDLLQAANPPDGSFGLEVHKVFHVGDAGVQYTWILVLWGDPSDVRAKIEPILSRKQASPPSFALGKKPTAPRAPRRAVQEVAPADEDDEEVPPLAVPGLQQDGLHNIRKVEETDIGTTKTTIKLAHVRGEMFMKNRDPHEVINLATSRGRFRAVVQDRGEAEFAMRKEGGSL